MVDEQTVLQLVADVLGERPLHATYMPCGHNSVTYDVALPERHVIVCMNRRAGTFAGTARNLTLLAGLGLPVPQVLTSDFTRTRVPCEFMILNKIPGRDLRYELAAMTQAQMTRLAEQLVDYQRRVMALPQGAGYGYVSIGEPGPHTSWWQAFLQDRQDNRQVNNEGAPDAGEVLGPWEERIQRQIARFEADMRRVPPICFLDDMTVKNVIMQAGELQGLVDFDCVCYGDPLYWMALTAAGVVSDVGTAELFYVEELARLWEVSDRQEQRLALYCVVHAAWFVLHFAAGETAEWRERMLSAIVRWMDRLA
jgi:aminoglycoside phosphotransferase (APT) family kinase protein